MPKSGQFHWEAKGDTIDLTVETDESAVTLNEITVTEIDGLINELQKAKDSIRD